MLRPRPRLAILLLLVVVLVLSVTGGPALRASQGSVNPRRLLCCSTSSNDIWPAEWLLPGTCDLER